MAEVYKGRVVGAEGFEKLRRHQAHPPRPRRGRALREDAAHRGAHPLGALAPQHRPDPRPRDLRGRRVLHRPRVRRGLRPAHDHRVRSPRGRDHPRGAVAAHRRRARAGAALRARAARARTGSRSASSTATCRRRTSSSRSRARSSCRTSAWPSGATIARWSAASRATYRTCRPSRRGRRRSIAAPTSSRWARVLFELLTGKRLREITDEVTGWSEVAAGRGPVRARALRPDLPPSVRGAAQPGARRRAEPALPRRRRLRRGDPPGARAR